MANYDEGVKKKIALRTVTRNLLACLRGYDYQFKVDALTEAMADVEAEVTETAAPPSIPAAPPVVAEVAADYAADEDEVVVEDDEDQAGDDQSRASCAVLVLKVLQEAAPKRLFTSEVTAAIHRIDPNVKPTQIRGTLHRLSKNKTLAKRGTYGNSRYSIRPIAEVSNEARPNGTGAGSTYGNSVSDVELHEKIIAELKTEPTGDYGSLAEKLLGQAHGQARKKIRNTMYYMERMRRIRRREDDKWEAIA